MTWRAISINREIYNKAMDNSNETTKIKNLKIELYLPPADIPQAVDAAQDKNKDIFTIYFQYTNSEKEKELFDQDNIKLVIGDQSGKPLRIEIRNIIKEQISQVKLTNIIRNDIGRLIESRINNVADGREKANLRCTEEVLKESADKIAQLV